MTQQPSPAFFYDLPTRIEFGLDKVHSLAEHCSRYGKKVLIVSYKDKSLVKSIDQAEAELRAKGLNVVRFEEVETNPVNTVVDACADLARAEKCNVVVGFGGGSAMDVAKAVAVTAVENVAIWQIVEGLPITTRPLALIAVPTTSGTGSEVTQYAVISNPQQKRKEGFGKKEFYPLVSILDPLLTVSAPPKITAATGMDALTHAIEGYTTKLANPLTDCLAEKAIGLIADYLPRAYADGQDLEARYNLMLGSMLAGMVITHCDTSLAHVMGEAVGAVFNTGHGLSVALCMPAVMEYNLETNVQKFAKIARLLNKQTHATDTHEAAIQAPQAFRDLLKKVNLPQGLAALGATEDEQVLKLCTRPGWDASNQRPAGREDFVALLRGSLSVHMSYWKEIQ